MKQVLLVVVVLGTALLAVGGCGMAEDEGIGVTRAAETVSPPDCTNGDCNPPPDCTNGDCTPPPDCTNGDCTPPPDCTNGDCNPPPDCTNGDCGVDLAACCCQGPNTPGTIRVCCCPSDDLSGMTCRESLVLSTGYPNNWHQTLDLVTLTGKRPKACDALLAKFCSPPEEEICTKAKGKKICTRVVKAVCKTLERVCQYRYCGPEWFPYGEAAPDKDGCEWWNKIQLCE